MKILERKRELEQESAAEKAKGAPVVSLGTGGFQVRTADSNFVFRVRGYVQGDARFYVDDPAGDCGTSAAILVNTEEPARRYAEAHFSAVRMANEYERLYQDLLVRESSRDVRAA